MTNCLPWILALAAYALAITALLVACRRRRRARARVSTPPSQLDRLLADHRDGVPLRTPTEDDKEEPC